MNTKTVVSLFCLVALMSIGGNTHCVESSLSIDQLFQVFETTQGQIDKGDELVIAKGVCKQLHRFARDHFGDSSRIFAKATQRYNGDRLEAFYAFYENLDGCSYE